MVCGVEPRRAVDEEEGVLDLLFLTEFVEE